MNGPVQSFTTELLLGIKRFVLIGVYSGGAGGTGILAGVSVSERVGHPLRAFGTSTGFKNGIPVDDSDVIPETKHTASRFMAAPMHLHTCEAVAVLLLAEYWIAPHFSRAAQDRLKYYFMKATLAHQLRC